ncbi:MAG: hypothetical protein C0485_06330, partial [Pirellula sp.]|nr:hypothetical protein [Pirellula sp.]
ETLFGAGGLIAEAAGEIALVAVAVHGGIVTPTGDGGVPSGSPLPSPVLRTDYRLRSRRER